MTTGDLLNMDAYRVWYWVSSIFLAVLLFRPTKKFILVQRVRKAERKLKRELTEEERKDLEKRTVPITAFIVITFAFLFNNVIMGKYYGLK
jgi:hypothetical protein